MTKEALKEGKNFLRRKDIKLIAKQANVRPEVVSRYINGHLTNSICAPYVQRMMEKRKDEFERATNTEKNKVRANEF